MPRTEVRFFQFAPNRSPVLSWLKDLRRADAEAYARCVAAISRLAEFGHELRRPLADFLQEGIYELRIRKSKVNYRILYFFHGRNVAILGLALTKEDRVPSADLVRVLRRRAMFEQDPEMHSLEVEE